MKKQMYAIATPRHSNRKRFDEAGEPDTTWHIDSRLGIHNSNIEAKFSFLVGMKVLLENKKYDDKFINGHFKYFQNLKQAKIVKINSQK